MAESGGASNVGTRGTGLADVDESNRGLIENANNPQSTNGASNASPVSPVAPAESAERPLCIFFLSAVSDSRKTDLLSVAVLDADLVRIELVQFLKKFGSVETNVNLAEIVNKGDVNSLILDTAELDRLTAELAELHFSLIPKHATGKDGVVPDSKQSKSESASPSPPAFTSSCFDSVDEPIFVKNMLALVRADVVIANISLPSTSVGYQIGVAQALGKPILCVHRPPPVDISTDTSGPTAASRAGLSGMLSGNRFLRVHTFSTVADAKAVIEAFLGEIIEKKKRASLAAKNGNP